MYVALTILWNTEYFDKFFLIRFPNVKKGSQEIWAQHDYRRTDRLVANVPRKEGTDGNVR